MAFASFVCANGKDGFYSIQDEIINENAKRVYVIKGGPGTGKSTLMKKVAEAAGARELIYCSSDPESLDGAVLKDGTVIFDGTAPHLAEPPVPGAAGKVINTGDFWDESKLSEKRDEINKLYHGISDEYAAAYRLLSAAGEVDGSIYDVEVTDREKLESYVRNLAKRRLPYTASTGKKSRRFIDAVCHKGEVRLENTLISDIKERIYISGGKKAAVEIMALFGEEAVSRGYAVTEFLSPLSPKRIAHLAVPEAGIAFTTSKELATRRINCERFIKSDIGAGKKRFYALLKESAVEAAVERLRNAKRLHDELEKYYIKAMDRAGLDAFTERIIASLT